MTAARTAGPYVAPETPTEVRLAVTWGTALKYPDPADVSTEDNFFASGGNSLIAVALVNRINREYGTKLPPPGPVRGTDPARTRRAHRRGSHRTGLPADPLDREGGFTPSSAGPGSAAIR